jgi:hypothetical protein
MNFNAGICQSAPLRVFPRPFIKRISSLSLPRHNATLLFGLFEYDEGWRRNGLLFRATDAWIALRQKRKEQPV